MKLRNFSAGLCVFLFVALLTFPLNAIGSPANKFNFFGNNRADFGVFTFPAANDGQIHWLLLRNDYPNLAGPGQGTIADIPWGQTATDSVPAFGNYSGDGRTDPALYRDNTGSPANTYMVQQAFNGANPPVI